MSMNAIHTYGIVTNDYDKAREKMEHIIKSNNKEIEYLSFNPNHMILVFEGGERYVRVRAVDNTRCIRIHGAYIDRNISIEFYENVVRKLMSGYCYWEEWI